MATKRVVRDSTPGFQYEAYVGCDTYDGETLIGTAEHIVGGYAPTEQEAREKMQRDLERLEDE